MGVFQPALHANQCQRVGIEFLEDRDCLRDPVSADPAGHPARRHVASIPAAHHPPADIQSWCHWKGAEEESTGYPIDHSDGGEDDDLEEHARWHEQLAARGRNPRSPYFSPRTAVKVTC